MAFASVSCGVLISMCFPYFATTEGDFGCCFGFSCVLCYILIKASRICLAVFHRLETDISICYQTTVAGQFAERHFAERHFAERHFAELFRQSVFQQYVWVPKPHC
jgi:hypothetical protein